MERERETKEDAPDPEKQGAGWERTELSSPGVPRVSTAKKQSPNRG